MKKMKKYFVILICIILVCCGGCREKNKKGNIEYISDQVKETDEEYTEKELEKIQTGIRQWAEGFLMVGSDVTDEERRLINQSFDKCIVSEEDRKKVAEDRQEFYEDSYIKIGLIDTNIEDARKVKYEDEELGKVTCEIQIYGTRNSNRFQRKYDLELVISFEDSVSVKEIDKIDWNSAEF